jgi:hypothetical protein
MVALLQPESVYGSFVPVFKEFHESIDGRVKLIHEFFIQIGEIQILPYHSVVTAIKTQSLIFRFRR